MESSTDRKFAFRMRWCMLDLGQPKTPVYGIADWLRLLLEWYFCSDLERTSPRATSPPRTKLIALLFRIREKTKLVLKATRLHARNLATFALIYKASMIVLRNIPAGAGKEGRYDSFFAGLLGGYAVFGRQPGSISKQVCNLDMRLIVGTIQTSTPEYTPSLQS